MTAPYYADDAVTLYAGDCLDVLPTLPDNSVDAVVTDPPYGLEFMGKEWDKFTDTAAKFRRPLESDQARDNQPRGDWKSSGIKRGSMPDAYRAGSAFQDWCQLWAAECLRVLKPGGHLLAFGGSRTWHRLAVAIEDAGFEIRDSIAWLYGSGFPKSLDVSKAIDKANGRQFEDRYALGREIRAAREAAGLTAADVNGWFGYRDGCQHWERQDASGARVPTLADFHVLRGRLGLSDQHLPLVEREEAEREIVGKIASPAGNGAAGTVALGGAWQDSPDVTAPATDAAQQWQGWGTALKPAHEPVLCARKPFSDSTCEHCGRTYRRPGGGKYCSVACYDQHRNENLKWDGATAGSSPAHEPIVVARKPLAGTVAANVLAHGTGALNIDGGRIAHDEPAGHPSTGMHGRAAGIMGATVERYRETTAASTAGRWPANVALDETAAAALDHMSGETVSTGGAMGGTLGANGILGAFEHNGPRANAGGLGDSGGASRFFYTAKAGSDERITHDGVAHPTVKPLALMRWLTRLVCPPGGLILEPFAGSGTTVEAAILEGFRCVAIEREPDYLPLITQRLNRRRDPVAYLTAAGEDLGLFDEEPA